MPQRLLSFGIFLLGLVLAAVSCVIFYTLRIDAIETAHQNALSALAAQADEQVTLVSDLDGQLATKDGQIQQLQATVAELAARSDDQTAKIQDLAVQNQELTAQLLQSSRPVLASAELKDSWKSKTPEQQELARWAEIRRISRMPDLTVDECRRKYKELSFSMRLQLEAALQGDDDLWKTVSLHNRLHALEPLRQLVLLIVKMEDSEEQYRVLLAPSAQQKVISKMRGNEFTMEDQEAWRKFISLDPARKFEILAEITRNPDLITISRLPHAPSTGTSSTEYGISILKIKESTGASFKPTWEGLPRVSQYTGMDFLLFLLQTPPEVYP